MTHKASGPPPSRRRALAVDPSLPVPRAESDGSPAAGADGPASTVEVALRLLITALTSVHAPVSGPGGAVGEMPLLDVAETAELLNVSRMTVVRLVDERRMPSIIVRRGKSHKIRRIPRAFIERLLAAASAGAQVDIEQFTTTWLEELARQ